MYYGANVDARLFMGTSTATPLPAPGTDTFDEVPLTGSIGIPANTRETAFFNVTNDASRRSLGGKLGDQICEGNVVIDWEEDAHNLMYEDSRVSPARFRNWYIEYPTGRRLDFRGFVSNWAEEAFDASEDAREHRANFTITIDGGVTLAATP